MRYSKQREVVYNVLCATDAHPDVSYIYREARKILPSISLGTVYRNLDELCLSKRAKRIGVEGSAERFDAKTHSHAHFVCTVCGMVLDVEEPTVAVECRHGDVERAEVMLYGVCEHCKIQFDTEKH